ncbi:Uncharacterized protein TCM_020207 [Theobroma cacao]|uniref:RNase H type-1 domain-containing protein n=1 Tax=Theobroma cacao TaxID=3641 RepID=A0A061ES32_THECC|nr:Uncharacterized protein TCM_020207 [Theobroma cacao]
MATLFSAWNEVVIKKGEIQIWKMAFFAMIWSMWLAGNEVVFEGKPWDHDQLYDLIKLRVATWAKVKWPREYGTILNTFAEPSVGAVLKKAKKSRPEIEWEKTMEGTMKFNVDGAANASMGEAGIGGVQRNSRGEIRMMFSKSIGVGDSSLAEVLAIREAFVMFIASQRGDSHMLLVEVTR